MYMCTNNFDWCELQKTAGESVGQRIIDKISKQSPNHDHDHDHDHNHQHHDHDHDHHAGWIIILFKSLLRHCLYEATIENPSVAPTRPPTAVWKVARKPKWSMHLSFKKSAALLASPSHSILANPTLGSTALIYSKLVHPSSTHWKHPTPIVKLHWILFSSHSILIQTYLNLVFCSNKHKGDSNERWAL